MAKWIVRETDYGSGIARIKFTLQNGMEISAVVEDCDGDFCAWGVRENGITVAAGDEYDIETDNNGPVHHAWDIAMRKANYFIATGKELKL